MPCRPRLTLPNVPLHLIQRGNNRQVCFAADDDFLVYLDWLGEYAGKTDCRIHAYVLMTNHVHLLISAERAEAPGQLRRHSDSGMCSVSIAPTDVAGPCGRAGVAPAWYKQRVIC